MVDSRVDGRMPDQLRPTTIRRSYLESAPGSALIVSGGTKLICTVSSVNRVPPFVEGTGRGWLTCEYGMPQDLLDSVFRVKLPWAGRTAARERFND